MLSPNTAAFEGVKNHLLDNFPLDTFSIAPCIVPCKELNLLPLI